MSENLGCQHERFGSVRTQLLILFHLAFRHVLALYSDNSNHQKLFFKSVRHLLSHLVDALGSLHNMVEINIHNIGLFVGFIIGLEVIYNAA